MTDKLDNKTMELMGKVSEASAKYWQVKDEQREAEMACFREEKKAIDDLLRHLNGQ